MSVDLNSQLQLLNAYKFTFASRKGLSDPSKWYPSTAKEIDLLLKAFLKDFQEAKKFENDLKNFLEESYAHIIENDISLIAKRGDHIDWLTEEKKIWKNANSTNSQFAYYKSKAAIHLGSGFDEMDNSTDQILSLLEDPNRSKKWATKGMVVGDVQSGKTSHYNGLITKAIDSGYKLIIVMSGIYNSLRAQTQKRIMENTIHSGDPGECNKIFFATDTPKYYFKDGIRKVDKENDFNTAIASGISITNKDPLVMVIKKHVSILSNILIWLNKQGLEHQEEEWKWNKDKWKNEKIRDLLPKHPLLCNQPMLLIDDECDSASIDISKRQTKGPQDQMSEEDQKLFMETDPSKTNQLIRRILKCFKRNAYVGYTATPLANIMINYSSQKDDEGGDLFPNDFIKLLARREDYISPDKVFGIAEKNYDPDEEVVSLSEDIDGEETPQVKWIYDYRDDFDDPIFIREDGSIDNKERDKKYREEAKDKDVKGWAPLYHLNGHQCLYKEDDTIPQSLKNSLKNFLINIAIRDIRKNKIIHNSMLIHVSRFTRVQQTVAAQIKKYIGDIKQSVLYGQDPKIRENIKKEFETIWNNDVKKNFDTKKYPDSEKIKFELVWNKVLETITSEGNPLDIVQINSPSQDVLNYDEHKKGWNVIVVGGAAVSRGITLEGLSISYFTRLAKIPTLDTLVQMGRWFGYRKGYEDLYRIYVPKILHILFRQFSFTMEKAREKFSDLSEQGRRPADYAFEIPSFTGWNLIAKDKAKDMSTLREPYTYFTATSRTPVMYFKDERRVENINLTENLIESLSSNFETEIEINKRLEKEKIFAPIPFDDFKIDNNLPIDEIRKKIFDKGKDPIKFRKAYLWKDVDVNQIVKYLANYKVPQQNGWTSKLIALQIKALKEFKRLDSWNLALFSVKTGPKYSNIKFKKNKIDISIQQRSLKPIFNKDYLSIGTLSDPSAEFVDMSGEEYNEGIESWLNLYKKTNKCVIKRRKINFLPADFKQKIRQKRKSGLLVIYPWSNEFKENLDPKKDIYMGWQVIIPPTRKEDEEEELIFDQDCNQAAREAREEKIKDLFNPDLFS